MKEDKLLLAELASFRLYLICRKAKQNNTLPRPDKHEEIRELLADLESWLVGR